MTTRFSRRDLLFIAVCLALTVASLVVIVRWFHAAFPEASIDFRYDRVSSRYIAESLLAAEKIDVRGYKRAAVFDADDEARIFLERSLGLEPATRVMKSDVRVWFWHHRWFKPLQEEEFQVEIAPTGELVSYSRTIPESLAIPAATPAGARRIAEEFLARNGNPIAGLDLVTQSERQLPKRLQRIFTWEAKAIHPAGSSYRHTITVDGNAVSSYSQQLKVPETWLRSYRELRSKNAAAGSIDSIFMAITMLGALVIFVTRLRRGDIPLKFLLAMGVVTVILVGGVTVNSLPSALASYDTTTSYPAFVAQVVVVTILQSVGTAMLLIVICGSGEVLYRQRLPQHLAIPKLWTPRALASKRVFLSLVLGYSLVAFFIAYQVAFYLIAARYGAWAPADVPYDDILNTSIPWIAVLFAGFFPAFSEEFLSRAFSIPFFQKFLRSRVAAIVLAGFVWGFGHSLYPNQPFYIRGVEVGLAGVLLGFLMDRYGLLALLIWHYTVDAVYTSLLLFQSGNAYYVLSASVASAVFAVPLLLSIALYIRNRGFIPDDDLTNATMPVSPPPPAPQLAAPSPLPPATLITRRHMIICAVALALAAIVLALRPASPQDAVDYRITSDRAKQLAGQHIESRGHRLPAKVAAVPVAGFRSWEDGSPREEGGSPGGFDDVAATYMLRRGVSVERLVQIFRGEVPAATWIVRFFTPMVKTEFFVEVDPRTSRVAGYHKYADENAPGARLERPEALAIALGSFAAYGVNVADFEVREALAFQQPKRRDWLFHFQQRTPLKDEAVRRVSVRVMGTEVTQFASTVKVPDAIHREAAEQGVADVVLMVLKFAGMIAALALVVTGIIVASRDGIEWKRALRATLLLAPVPIMRALTSYESRVFSYSTSVGWDTFLLSLISGSAGMIGLQLLLLFIAVVGIRTIYPYAFALLSRAGRVRFGRPAAIAAVTAVTISVAWSELTAIIENYLPRTRVIEALDISSSVAIPLPSLFKLADALFGAIVMAGAVALIAKAMLSWPSARAASITTIAIAFCIFLDGSADRHALPMMLAISAVTAALIWLVARYVLGGHLLAWPLAFFLVSSIDGGVAMIRNARPDLVLHGSIVMATALVLITWLASPRTEG